MPDEGISAKDETVVQHVLRSDERRERLMEEARVLMEAVEDNDNSTAMVQAYRRVTHRRLETREAEAKQIALRRSGARGAKARKVLLDLEAELADSVARLQVEPDRLESDEIAKETQSAALMSAEVESSLESMDASALESRARTVLRGLGFSVSRQEQPVSQLSSGWNTRCNLACALCQSPDLLLLDEPTNFLDLPSIIWLEQYVQTLGPATTVVVVTHDRAFADAVADELLVLRNLSIETFRGNLSAYEAERAATYRYMNRMKQAQEKQKRHMQSSIDHGMKAAQRTGDDKKLKQVASRRKKLDERMGLEVSAKGGRFKLNRDLAGYHTSYRAEIELPTFDSPARMSFPMSPPDLRTAGALLSFERVAFSYPQSERRTALFRDINLTVHLGDRIGIAGVNGSGKSTLVTMAMSGANEENKSLVPSQGTISRHPRARVGLYNQQAAEELDFLAAKEPNITALSLLMQVASLTDKDARGVLASLGLHGKTVSDVPIALLSAGQKVRLALARLLCIPPHLLILDEVTTHLDADTILALATALRNYGGAVLVITHDRFFMRCVIEGESARSMVLFTDCQRGF